MPALFTSTSSWPELLVAAPDRLGDLLGASHVRRDRQGADTALTTAASSLLEIVARCQGVRAALEIATDVDQQQIGACLGERFGGGAAGAAAGSGHRDDPAHAPQPKSMPTSS